MFKSTPPAKKDSPPFRRVRTDFRPSQWMKNLTWRPPRPSFSDRLLFRMIWTTNYHGNSSAKPTLHTRNYRILPTSQMSCHHPQASAAICQAVPFLNAITLSKRKLKIRSNHPRRNLNRRTNYGPQNQCIKTNCQKCRWSWMINRNCIFSFRMFQMTSWDEISNSEWAHQKREEAQDLKKDLIALTSLLRKSKAFKRLASTWRLTAPE